MTTASYFSIIMNYPDFSHRMHLKAAEIMAEEGNRYLLMPAYYAVHFFTVVLDMQEKKLLFGEHNQIITIH